MLGGRYELGEKIGEGGAAVVYRARDTRLDRPVAVKVLRSQFVDDRDAVVRFQREARAAASLAHPNVVPVYDYGQDGDTHFIVLELLPGPTLKGYLSARGALPVGEALAIARQILAGLQAAHDRGLVHRDVKPQNVLFAADGSVKVADFGIARALAAPALTAAGEAIGTASYLSPEQARGEPVGPASDVYSAGVVLYEMLAGRPPFTGDTGLAIALKHVAELPAPLDEVAPGVPAGIARIVGRALAKDPSERWPDAAALAGALADYAAASEEVTQVPRPGASRGRLGTEAPISEQPTSIWRPAGMDEPTAVWRRLEPGQAAAPWRPPQPPRRPATGPAVPARPPTTRIAVPNARRRQDRPLVGTLATLFLVGFLFAFCAGAALLLADRPAAVSLLDRAAALVAPAPGLPPGRGLVPGS